MSENANTRPQLGQWMTINQMAYKSRWKGTTKWQRQNWRRNPLTGMFIGWRTVFDGRTEHEVEYQEYGPNIELAPYFVPTEHHEVWLFVTSERRNPIYAFPEDVSALEVVQS
jgi:hypothetical protein